jgi:hypothetical protein
MNGGLAVLTSAQACVSDDETDDGGDEREDGYRRGGKGRSISLPQVPREVVWC